jgi:phage-related protein
MPLGTFVWQPTRAKLTEQPRVDVVSFGDGYELSLQRGLNPIRQVWSLSFEDCEPRWAKKILAFLRTQKAQERFNWTTPTGDALLVKCRAWDMDISGDVLTISCTFEQVFNVE